MSTHTLTWRPAPYVHRLATVALLAMLAALASGRTELLLLAAPLLTALAAGHAAARPQPLRVDVRVSARRCFEDEDIELTVTAALPVRADRLTVELFPGPVTLISGAMRQESTGRWLLRPNRWGRHALASITLDVQSGGWHARLRLSAGEITVFPRWERVRPCLAPAELLARIGEHVSRAAGAGVEFAGIRPYTSGDRLRDLNWSAGARYGRLHVTTRAAERQAEIVVVVDALSEATMDRAMHGAASIANAYLRRGDRVGVIALGAPLRWLSPALGERQFYRIAETVMRSRLFHSELPPDLRRIPRPALPASAVAIVFSPLLDDSAVTAIAELRRRGNDVVILDILDREPPRADPIVLRLWRLDHTATQQRLADLGVLIVPWTPGEALDSALARLPRRGRAS